MRFTLVISSILVVISVIELYAADELAAKYPLLSQLTLPKDAIPDGCEIPEIPADATPIKGLKNRSITTDPRAFVLGDERLKELIDPKEVEAVYLAVYKEKNELGITGWTLKTEDAAKKMHKRLADSYAKEPERFRFWQVKNHVIDLWRDPGTTDECFRQFETYIQEKIDAFQKQEPKTKPAP